jgi:hypothetical protein
VSLDPEARVSSAPALGVWSRVISGIRTVLASINRQLPNIDPKSLFPIGIEVSQGAIICGNLSTPNLLVLEFQAAHGAYGAVQVHRFVLAPSPH